MTPSELRTAMTTLLNGGNAWCKGAYARDEEGKPCPARSPQAVQWDFYGAMIKALEGESDYTAYHAVLDDLTKSIPTTSRSRDIDLWNDSIEWSEFERAITSTPLQVRMGGGESMTVTSLGEAE